MISAYRHESVFQLIPSDRETPKDIEYPAVVELNLEFSNPLHANDDKDNKGIIFCRELLAIIALITRSQVTFDEIELVDITEFTEYKDDMSQFRSAYQLDDDWGFHNSMLFNDDTIHIPGSIERFCLSYFSQPDEDRLRHHMSLTLFNNADRIWMNAPSLSFVGMISAVENLADLTSSKKGIKPERCKSCGQLKHSSTKKFVGFMNQYSDEKITNCSEKLIKQYYSKRSKIVHVASLMKLDYDRVGYLSDEYNELADLKRNIRVVLYNYIKNLTSE